MEFKKLLHIFVSLVEGSVPEGIKEPISELGRELEKTAETFGSFVEDMDGVKSHNSDLLCWNGELEDENVRLKAEIARLKSPPNADPVCVECSTPKNRPLIIETKTAEEVIDIIAETLKAKWKGEDLAGIADDIVSSIITYLGDSMFEVKG
jgi:hypothetical protein